MKALINAWIFDFESFSKNYYILFDTEIREIGEMKNFKGAEEVYDCSNCIVMPGLVNCHTHVYSTLSRGMNIPFNPKNFRDILEQLWWKLDRQLDNNSTYYSGLVYGMDCIRNGVTTIIDHHASGIDIEGSLSKLKDAICGILGLRGIFCFESSDRFSINACIDENLNFSKYKSEKYAGLFGMHASMSLSDESLQKISSCIKNMPIHIHIAESLDDVSDCQKKYGMSIVKRLDRFNLLNENSILSHCVHINDDDASLIKERKCFVALNPTSNMNNAVGLSDFDLFRKNNIKCLIGSDGLGSNITRDYMNMVFSMRHRLKSPTKFNLDDLVKMIENGYEYISNLLNIKVGRIKEGYKADMIVVPYNPPTPMEKDNAMGHVFFGMFDNFHPRDVWVSGKNLLKDYKLCFNPEEIYIKSKIEAEKVWQRIEKSDR